MEIALIISIVLGIIVHFVGLYLPVRPIDPYAGQPNVFRVWLVKPPSESVMVGCYIFFGVLLTAYGYIAKDQTFVWVTALLLVLCLSRILFLTFRELPQTRIENKSLARIELTPNSLCIYDEVGQMVNEAKFADIVDLPMYQGLDENGRHYVDRILVMRSGEEIVLPRYGKNGRDLKIRIHRATNMKFSFRNNSTRRQS